MRKSSFPTKSVLGIVVCLAGLLGCNSEDSDDGYLPANGSLGPLGGAAPIVNVSFERKGWVTVYSPRFRSYEPFPRLNGTPDDNRAMLHARAARKRDPDTYLMPSRFLEFHPDTKLADFGRYQMVRIYNPQFFEWSILEGAEVETVRLRPASSCISEARVDSGGACAYAPLETSEIPLEGAELDAARQRSRRSCLSKAKLNGPGCAYAHQESFVAPEDLRKLSTVVGLKNLVLDVAQPIGDEFVDALNFLLGTFPDMETLVIPQEIDRCLVRWPRSMRTVAWPEPDTLNIPGRASRLEYRPYTDKDGNQFDRLAFADGGEFIPHQFWDDENPIAVIGPYVNPKPTGFRSSPAYLQARGTSIEEMLRLNCERDAPALYHFREAPP